jgi:hypothetical protein
MQRGLHPSVPALAFAIWWVVASVVFPERMLNADGDMLRHIRHGQEMLAQRSLIHHDPFSFTRGGDPFVGFEYGSQIVYALVHQVAGLAGVAIFAGLLIATAYALLARFMISRGVDTFLAYLVSVWAALLGAVHWSPRPHLFTLVFVVVMLWLLEPSDESESADGNVIARRPSGRRSNRVALLSHPLFLTFILYAVWANLHGGWVFGLVLFGIYLAGSIAEYLRHRGAEASRGYWKGRARYYATAIVVALAATFLTPHGVALHRHIIEFFGTPFLMENTQEFFSPDFHTAGGRLLLVSLLLIITAFVFEPTRLSFPHLFLLLANIAFALQARRNIPLLGATVLPILALAFDAAWRRLPDWRGIRHVFDRDSRRGRVWPLATVLVLVFGALALAGGRVGGVQVVPNTLSPREFPLHVAQRARADGYGGRLFHDFVWGGYILYAWPEQKVYIDGGTDFYGPELMASHMNVVGLAPGWRKVLDRWEVDGVLMPTGASMLYELALDGIWHLRDCDATATFLDRTPANGAPLATAESLEQCRNR